MARKPSGPKSRLSQLTVRVSDDELAMIRSKFTPDQLRNLILDAALGVPKADAVTIESWREGFASGVYVTVNDGEPIKVQLDYTPKTG